MSVSQSVAADQKFATIYPGQNSNLVFDYDENEAVKIVSIKLHDANDPGQATPTIRRWAGLTVFLTSLQTLDRNNTGPITMEFICLPDECLVVNGDAAIDVVYEVVAMPDSDDEEGVELSDSDDDEDEEEESDPEIFDEDDGVTLHF